MKTIIASFLIILLFLPATASCEILIIKQTVKQTFGGGQSPDDARIYAIAKAKREALEKAGTYIENLTVVKNSKIEKDEILALTAGILKAEVVSQKNYASADAFGIEIVVNVDVDTSILEERVKKQLQDRTHLAELRDAQKREKELLLKVAQLEEENRKLMVGNQSTQNLKKEFQQASQELTALDWFNKASELAIFSDSQKVIEYLNNAIKMKPDYAKAYNNRGNAYTRLGQHQRAIEDYNKAILLNPDYAYAYSNRGLAYSDLGQHKRSIEDYNKAIRLQPNDAIAYSNRGIAYYHLDQNQQAITDYSKAIRLQPDLVQAYYNRGLTYSRLGQHQRAIDDYNEAIRLNPDFAGAYYDRGNTYSNLGQHQQAIEDYDKAIRLKPDLAQAFNNRGAAYSDLGQHQQALENYNEVILLKPDDAGAYSNRGLTYSRLGQYQKAIEDYNEAIRLQPNLVEAYYNRGLAYLHQDNNKLGCRDAQTACTLGNCKLLKTAKGRGLCL